MIQSLFDWLFRVLESLAGLVLDRILDLLPVRPVKDRTWSVRPVHDDNLSGLDQKLTSHAINRFIALGQTLQQMMKKRRTRMKKWIAVALPLMLAMTATPNGSSNVDTSKTDKKQATVHAVGKKVTFIELGSVKCIPCMMMQLVMKEIKKEYGEEVNVVFYDVRTPVGRPVAEKYRIRMIPTQVFLDEDGKEFSRHEGYFPKEDIVKLLKSRGIVK